MDAVLASMAEPRRAVGGIVVRSVFNLSVSGRGCRAPTIDRNRRCVAAQRGGVVDLIAQANSHASNTFSNPFYGCAAAAFAGSASTWRAICSNRRYSPIEVSISAAEYRADSSNPSRRKSSTAPSDPNPACRFSSK